MVEKEEKLVLKPKGDDGQKEEKRERDGQVVETTGNPVVEALENQGVESAESVNVEAMAEGGTEVAENPVGDEAESVNGEAAEASGVEGDVDVTEGAAAMGAADIERLIAEAEARGYERGRNAGIEAWMQEGREERGDGRAVVDDDVGDSEVLILNNMRRSVWE